MCDYERDQTCTPRVCECDKNVLQVQSFYALAPVVDGYGFWLTIVVVWVRFRLNPICYGVDKNWPMFSFSIN